ncbi:MAG: peptidase, partial [Candidatus Saccharibacteria bacterium]|nr:peptidase [Candidatus Saccharibacteria bacterium]
MGNVKRRPLLLILLCIIIACTCGYFLFKGDDSASSSQSSAKTTDGKEADNTLKQPTFNTKQHSLTEPTSIWVVVNKKLPLQPKTYTPTDLVVPNIQLRSNITSDERQVRQVTATALASLAAAAKKDDVTLTLESGYRSYNMQVGLYNRYVSQQGQAVADSQSARAGHSEHQTGLVADLGGVTRPGCNVEA